MKKYKAIIMDYDQTIGDTADLILECLYENAKQFGITTDPQAMRRGLGGTAADLYRCSGIDDEDLLKKLDDSYAVYSVEPMMTKPGFFPGVAEGLAALKQRGITLAIFSMKDSAQIHAPLARCGLSEYISAVVGADNVSRGKPDPEGLYKLEQLLGLCADDILYVGDSMNDQRTAIAGGVDFAAVCTGFCTAEDFDRNHTVVICPTFSDLCRVVCAELDK